MVMPSYDNRGYQEDTPDLTQYHDHEEYQRTPWIFKEWRRGQGTRKVKLFLGLVGFIFGLWLMWSWFGWYFLLGLLPAPAWYFWALRQIDRDAYTVIEVRLKGDEKDGNIISNDTQTNIYQIPPDVWKETKIKGTPYTVGNRIYIADKVEEDEETGGWTLIFPDHPAFSNLNFYTRIKLWLELKKKVPKLMEDVAIYRHNIDIIAMERAVHILEKTHAIEVFIEEPDRRERKRVSRPMEGSEHVLEPSR